MHSSTVSMSSRRKYSRPSSSRPQRTVNSAFELTQPLYGVYRVPFEPGHTRGAWVGMAHALVVCDSGGVAMLLAVVLPEGYGIGGVRLPADEVERGAELLPSEDCCEPELIEPVLEPMLLW